MIIHGNSRGNAKQMGLHLLSDENDHIDVLEVRGFVHDDPVGGLQEAYAHSRATKCKKFLYSASFNPPEGVVLSDEQFFDTINRAEKKLGLVGQPRVIVTHEKDGNRKHAHCVWSRIDTEQMKAIPMAFDKDRLNELSRDLFIEHGWDMPQGFRNKQNRDLRNFNLAEWQQAKRHGLDAKQIKARIQHAWTISDDKKSFTSALAHEGFFLSRGDKKNVHVAVDWHGEVYAISRATGEKSKSVKAKLGEPDLLPTVDATKAKIIKEQGLLHTKLQRELSLKHKAQNRPLRAKKRELVQAQRLERKQLNAAQAQRQLYEQQQRQAQYAKGWRGLWSKVTGKYRSQRKRHEQEYKQSLTRDANEKQTLIEKQLVTRQTLQKQLNEVKERQQKESMALHADFVASLHDQTLQVALEREIYEVQRFTPQQHFSPEVRL